MCQTIILASQSPRRKTLLQTAGYDVLVIPPDESAEHSVEFIDDPRCFVKEAAEAKARFVAKRLKEGVVLAADTIAVCDSQRLGKPTDREDARRMLRQLSGRRHRVLTGVVLWHRPSDRIVRKIAETELQMDVLEEAEIESYLDTGLWKGKAGGFGYQDGWDWLHVVRGSESNVVGLPIESLPVWLDELIQLTRFSRPDQ